MPARAFEPRRATMIIAQWTCEVPAKKREALLRFVKEEMKEVYLNHGCRRHELLVPIASRKKYFPFHEDLDRLTYIEQLSFEDLRAFEYFLGTMDEDALARAATARYETKFGVRHCRFTLLGLES